MLKSENRLKARSAFGATYKNHNIISDENIILYVGKYKQDKNCPTRVGFVVSKKVSKRAVKRNRIKRLMREVVRLMYLNSEYSVLNEYQSFIFYAKCNSLNKSFDEIRNTILILLDKLANKKN